MPSSTLHFLWNYAKKFRWLFLGMSILTIISQVFDRLSLWYTSILFDYVAKEFGVEGYYKETIRIMLLVILFHLLRRSIFGISMFIDAKQRPKIVTLVTKEAFEYANKQSINYFHTQMSGRIASKIEQLANSTSSAARLAWETVHMVFLFAISVVMLSGLSLFFLPTTLGYIVIAVVSGMYLGKKRRIIKKELSEFRAKSTGVIVDSISNFSEIKSFANYRFEKRNLFKTLRKLRLSEVKDQMIHSWFRIFQDVTVMLFMVLFMGQSLWLLYTGRIEVAGFIFANMMLANFSWLITNIMYVYMDATQICGTIDAALKTLSIEPDIIDKPNAKDLKIKSARISFKNVGFAYQDKEAMFNHLNIEIKAGEKIGLVGHSGAGKSTFIKLISRYFDIQEGSIAINDIDIRDIAQDSLHRNIAVIPQDVSLFNRPLMENIRYGKITASDAEVIASTKKAAADEFIRNFPNDYQTIVGERGVILSGGERQRIAIARAILKNAPILIFDEATSALDSHSEKKIQKSLQTLMKGKTVIAIAHRLSTLREMDKIIMFDKGKIVEQGSHESLLRKKGKYYKLYKMQSDGFISTASPIKTEEWQHLSLGDLHLHNE